MQTIESITIRRGDPADNRLIAEMGRQTFSDSFAADNRPEDMRVYLDRSFNPRKQASELNDPASVFLIAEIGGEPAGYARLVCEPPSGFVRADRPMHLERIYALKRWIGRGVGPALMRACIDEAGRKHADGLWLGVWERNHRALRFYHKWGFSPVGTQPFQLGDDLQTDQVLWLPLSPAVHAPLDRSHMEERSVTR